MARRKQQQGKITTSGYSPNGQKSTHAQIKAMNKLMKYTYLPDRKNITLSTLTSTIVEEFVHTLPPIQVRYQKFQADVPIWHI